MYVFPADLKTNLAKLPIVMAEVISDNVALAVRIRGLVAYLKECKNTCSPTVACIDNLKKVFEFFGKSTS